MLFRHLALCYHTVRKVEDTLVHTWRLAHLGSITSVATSVRFVKKAVGRGRFGPKGRNPRPEGSRAGDVRGSPHPTSEVWGAMSAPQWGPPSTFGTCYCWGNAYKCIYCSRPATPQANICGNQWGSSSTNGDQTPKPRQIEHWYQRMMSPFTFSRARRHRQTVSYSCVGPTALAVYYKPFCWGNRIVLCILRFCSRWIDWEVGVTYQVRKCLSITLCQVSATLVDMVCL